MGFCPKRTLSKKIINLKITKLIEVEENQRWSRAYFKEKVGIVSRITKKIIVKLINEKEYLTTKRIRESLNIKKIKIIISLKIKKIDRKG